MRFLNVKKIVLSNFERCGTLLLQRTASVSNHFSFVHLATDAPFTSGWELAPLLDYSITRHFGRWWCKCWCNSGVAPGQLVSSSSCKCRSWTKEERPLELTWEQPEKKTMIYINQIRVIVSMKYVTAKWLQRRYSKLNTLLIRMLSIPFYVE